MGFESKNVLVTGGTGSLGQVLVRRLLSGEAGRPAKVVVFSRDETKQHQMRLDFLHREAATDEVIYENSRNLLSFQIGDVRDFGSVIRVMRDADVVFNAAALKQVPTCEYFPYEAVQTNITGAENIVRAVREQFSSPELVLGVSTDKACKPINVMGMSKAIQERILLTAPIICPASRFVCVRYGNVIASRGSVVPLFIAQIKRGGPVTITLREMTRFLLSLDRAVDTIFAAARHGRSGETWVPKVPSARVVDLANVLIGDRRIDVTFTGIRPGEKVHEIMVSEDERFRTVESGDYYVIRSALPEMGDNFVGEPVLAGEYSSSTAPMSVREVGELLSLSGLRME